MEPMLRDDEARARIAECSNAAFAAHFCTQIPSHAVFANRGLWFALMCRNLWPNKAPAAIADLTGLESDGSTFRRWVSGHSEPPVSVLWLLLRSREGSRVLAFILEFEPPEWWAVHQRALAELAVMGERICAQINSLRQKTGSVLADFGGKDFRADKSKSAPA